MADESLVSPAANAMPETQLAPPEQPGQSDAGKMPAKLDSSDEGQPVKGANGETISPQLLRVPAFQALFSGSPPALSLPLKGFDNKPEAKLIKQDAPGLKAAGIGFYKSMSGQFGVLFNQLYVHPQDIQAADKTGNLLAIAPPFDAIDHAVGKSGAMNPVIHRQEVPGGLAPARSTVTPPQVASGKGLIAKPGTSSQGNPGMPLGIPVRPAPAGVQRKLATERILNLNPGAPTTGPEPGAGRLLNAILKPVV